MGVAAGGGEALVAKRLLHEVGRGAPVEGVGGVGVAEPVRGNVLFDAGRPGSSPHDPPELTAGERAVRLLRAKHRIAVRAESCERFRMAERDKDIPRWRG